MNNLQDAITERFTQVYLKLKEAKRFKTQKEVAAKIDWDASSISQSLKNERTIPLQKAITFCKVYGVNQDWLLDGKGRMFTGDTGKQPAELTTHHITENIVSDDSTEELVKSFETLLKHKNNRIKALEMENELLHQQINNLTTKKKASNDV